jgi:predicted permease
VRALRALLYRLGGLFHKDRRDREFSTEMESHLQLHIEENLHAGMNPQEARREAVMKLGGIEQTKEVYRDRRGLPALEVLLQDLRFALRMLRKNPGFTAVAILTLALGIGANAAIFTVVHAVLLRALPFPNANRLVQVQETVGREQANPVSYPNFLDWQAGNRGFEQMAAYTDAEFIVNVKEKSERILGENVTDAYFTVLGVHPVLGRTFLHDENQTPGTHAFAIIGYGFWQRVYGSDPLVVGKSVRVNNGDFTIIGVAPRGFHGFADDSEIWIPLTMRDVLWPETAQFHFLDSRDVHFLKTFAVLKPGVSLQQARADMATVAANLQQAYPKENAERGVLLIPAHDHFVGNLRTPLLVLLGAVGLVLMIACANVLNLFLTRTISRNRELAVRLSLGATFSRLLRQLLTESLLLALAGAAVGLAFAAWGLDALVPLLPITFPSFAAIHLDRSVLLFACALALAVGVLVGVLPTLGTSRMALSESLKEGSKASMGIRGRKLGGVLVAFEVALSLILLIGAGLLVQTVVRMLGADPGFRPDHLVSMRFYVPNRRFQDDAKNRFGPNLAQSIASIPGVQSAAVTFIDPFLWGGFSRGFTIEGHAPLTAAEIDEIAYQEIGPAFFHTMEIPLKSGREFTMRDDLKAPGRVIVNESFARRYWPGQNAVGKRLKYGPADSKYSWMEVIAVAGNSKFDSLRQIADTSPVVYGGLLQSEVIMNMSLIVRTQSDPAAMIGTLRDAIQRFDAEIPVYNVATLEQRMYENAAETRSYAILLGLFALVALTLAVVGIYGVISYWVGQRTQEMGVRMALGARQADVMRLVLWEGLRLTGAGILAGLLGAFFASRALQSMLFGVRPADPATFGALSALLLVVGLLACYIPARRATQVDPMVALRYE